MINLLKSSLFGLTLTMALASCSYLPSSVTPDTTPTQPTNTQNSLPDGPFTQCPPASSADTMCTMQYDPVCVKTQVGSVISYRTAGNACSACGKPEAVGYVKGECN
ncbi:hypothetical protein [Psychrobacter namhaensis]|uniref:hypothetical protein n=1 Tax=Psychrobacter namhaensis TaxID=292734 RepID=UPI0018DF1ACD|nr:hypothetical protein [Psychrobacter namhaensis]